ncbi:hypothetical protein Z043_110613 [Scleropages formosus]|uniref:Actin maturation protease n=1 Tax=Scleropages formosus TaxID=113540 RepID=A0A0P7UNJ9_SCLFO|nr:hypothetical protein Z043_110613 [Scleropages formosus]
MTSEHPALLPPPPPPPPCPALAWPAAPLWPSKKKLYQAIAEGRSAVEGDHEEARLVLVKRESRKHLQWVLFNKYVPSLIQDGPQCGLVALWMAAHLLQSPTELSIERIVKVAKERGYTAQGEIFSAHDMALLAEEMCGCRAERLTGGMSGPNFGLILKHLASGKPVLIPYDEDFNHEPCQRRGHRAHWAVASGILLALKEGCLNKEEFQPDPGVPWLLLPGDSPACPMEGIQDAFVLAKQGKSLHYQLLGLEKLAQSNAQLKEMDPKRAADGSVYILPQGGMEVGLAGQVVLLH